MVNSKAIVELLIIKKRNIKSLEQKVCDANKLK